MRYFLLLPLVLLSVAGCVVNTPAQREVVVEKRPQVVQRTVVERPQVVERNTVVVRP